MTRLLVTVGDVAGIGPEIAARGWPELLAFGQPVIVGDADGLRQALALVGSSAIVQPIRHLDDAEPSPELVPCLVVDTADLRDVQPGIITAAGGRAAYDFLCRAIDECLAGRADAIVTGPLHKEGLRLAGLTHPGHTEILAERCGSPRHAMLLHGDGVTVAHVTLHCSLREAVERITEAGVRDAIDLLAGILPRLDDGPVKIGVCALNPHASDGGLFGDEERRIVAPAVASARAAGIDAVGPLPSDALWVKADRGQFNGVVALYHDQGHIAMKMRSGMRAVNITAGLPIVRTSVAHGTAYDIAGQGVASAGSLIAAARVAARLVK